MPRTFLCSGELLEMTLNGLSQKSREERWVFFRTYQFMIIDMYVGYNLIIFMFSVKTKRLPHFNMEGHSVPVIFKSDMGKCQMALLGLLFISDIKMFLKKKPSLFFSFFFLKDPSLTFLATSFPAGIYGRRFLVSFPCFHSEQMLEGFALQRY